MKELLSGLTHLELTRSWIADLSSVINVSGEISDYLDSLEDAWRIYLNDVTVRLDEEMTSIEDTGILRLTESLKRSLLFDRNFHRM